jgi:NAD(P)-dependent dehydrogenase (short-subunit alcohol dehydrogenase family)
MGAIVVTGSTRGIGWSLVDAFLSRGQSVVVSGRTARAVEEAIERLAKKHDRARIAGAACDVTKAAELAALWDAASARFGGVDAWINNAGTCNSALPYVEVPIEEIESVIDTNLRGGMLASRIALERMLAQGHGKLFNMEGWGSRGEWSAGLTAYSTTKRGLRYFTDALVRETRDSPVKIGTLGPGMVATDLLVSSWEHGRPENWKKMAWIFHFVIDPPEPVCGWLADKVLSTTSTGRHYTWMPWWKVVGRLFLPHYWKRKPIAGTALERIGS